MYLKDADILVNSRHWIWTQLDPLPGQRYPRTPKEMQAEGMKGPLKEENKDKALTGIKTIYCTVQEVLHKGIHGAG